jgi:hypothetical protein
MASEGIDTGQEGAIGLTIRLELIFDGGEFFRLLAEDLGTASMAMARRSAAAVRR